MLVFGPLTALGSCPSKSAWSCRCLAAIRSRSHCSRSRASRLTTKLRDRATCCAAFNWLFSLAGWGFFKSFFTVMKLSYTAARCNDNVLAVRDADPLPPPAFGVDGTAQFVADPSLAMLPLSVVVVRLGLRIERIEPEGVRSGVPPSPPPPRMLLIEEKVPLGRDTAARNWFIPDAGECSALKPIDSSPRSPSTQSERRENAASRGVLASREPRRNAEKRPKKKRQGKEVRKMSWIFQIFFFPLSTRE